jgi:hypothetical protein
MVTMPRISLGVELLGVWLETAFGRRPPSAAARPDPELERRDAGT